jgi:DNA-binding LytR/AlgR family response regulator
MAADDEPPALDVLKEYIAAVPTLQLAGTCNNGIEALTMLRKQNIDLLFIDIKMPQLSGTDLIKSLEKPPKVIFTTAFREYALEGFELNAVDFLLKPISFERFVKAVNKVINVLSEVNGQKEIVQLNEPMPNFIYFRADRKILKVLLDDILFIESLKDYIKVVTKTRTIITRQCISALESSLPKNLFIRIHRSFIVSFKNIDCFTSERIEVAKYELPVSRLYRHEVENRMLLQ